MDKNSSKIKILRNLMDTMRDLMVAGDGDEPLSKKEVTKAIEEEPEQKEEDPEEESDGFEEKPEKHKEHGMPSIPIMSLLKKAKAAPKAFVMEKITVAKKPEMPDNLFKKKKA